jgi:hypothetical protein
MGKSPKHIDKRCIFRQTFGSELEVRRNGGVPSNVTFRDGKGVFNGSSSYINYKRFRKGATTIRIKFTPSSNVGPAYLFDLRTNDVSELTWCYYDFTTNSFSKPATATIYINGSVGTTISNGSTYDIVMVDTAALGNKVSIGRKGSSSSFYLNAQIELIEKGGKENMQEISKSLNKPIRFDFDPVQLSLENLK